MAEGLARAHDVAHRLPSEAASTKALAVHIAALDALVARARTETLSGEDETPADTAWQQTASVLAQWLTKQSPEVFDRLRAYGMTALRAVDQRIAAVRKQRGALAERVRHLLAQLRSSLVSAIAFQVTGGAPARAAVRFAGDVATEAGKKLAVPVGVVVVVLMAVAYLTRRRGGR